MGGFGRMGEIVRMKTTDRDFDRHMLATASIMDS